MKGGRGWELFGVKENERKEAKFNHKSRFAKHCFMLHASFNSIFNFLHCIPWFLFFSHFIRFDILLFRRPKRCSFLFIFSYLFIYFFFLNLLAYRRTNMLSLLQAWQLLNGERSTRNIGIYLNASLYGIWENPEVISVSMDFGWI